MRNKKLINCLLGNKCKSGLQIRVPEIFNFFAGFIGKRFNGLLAINNILFIFGNWHKVSPFVCISVVAYIKSGIKPVFN